MIIIEGKGNKHSQVLDIIEQQDEVTLIINTTGQKVAFMTDKKVIFLDQPLDMLNVMIDNNLLYQSVSSHPFDIDMVVFYMDGTKEDIERVKKFEEEVELPCSITIENNDMDGIKVYSI